MGEELKRLREIARKVVLCFPEIIPEGQEETKFNIPAYIIEELRNEIKGKDQFMATQKITRWAPQEQSNTETLKEILLHGELLVFFSL